MKNWVNLQQDIIETKELFGEFISWLEIAFRWSFFSVIILLIGCVIIKWLLQKNKKVGEITFGMLIGFCSMWIFGSFVISFFAYTN